jgi:hypothetical protein
MIKPKEFRYPKIWLPYNLTDGGMLRKNVMNTVTTKKLQLNDRCYDMILHPVKQKKAKH